MIFWLGCHAKDTLSITCNEFELEKGTNTSLPDRVVAQAIAVVGVLLFCFDTLGTSTSQGLPNDIETLLSPIMYNVLLYVNAQLLLFGNPKSVKFNASMRPNNSDNIIHHRI